MSFIFIYLNIFSDLSDNPLICNCEMSGFLDWVKRIIRLGPKSECHEPPSLKDVPLRNLRLDMLNCVRPKSNSTPAIEIIPNANLVNIYINFIC